jgi:hypothetical protein
MKGCPPKTSLPETLALQHSNGKIYALRGTGKQGTIAVSKTPSCDAKKKKLK